MPIETVVDAKPIPQAPVDPNVRIPDSVRAAAARAESFYQPQQQPAPPQPPAPELTPPVVAQVPAPAPAPQPPAPPQPPPVLEPEVDPTIRPPGDPSTWNEWEKRYNAMRGRFTQQTGLLTQMQDQMTQLGDELLAAQQEIRRLQSVPRTDPQATQQQQQQPPRQHLTPQDQEEYGPLLDVAKRAAMDALGPELERLRTENLRLGQQLQRTQGSTVYQFMDRELPTWRQVNASPEFKAWLNLPDIKSGMVRGKLLNNAHRAGEAARVKAFFDEFLMEQGLASPSPPPQPAAEPALQPQQPRQPALSLASLAAPGRPTPAPGGTDTPQEKPTFTRAQISQFYADVRRGVYVGREQEKVALEQAIFAAQNDGRVR